MSAPPGASASIPKRWTLHGLNNGIIFGLTVRGVRVLPRAFSYGIGHAGTWLAWRLMPGTNAAIASNLQPLMPGESERALRRSALKTYRSYAHDTIDFLRALSASDDEVRRTFELRSEDRKIFEGVLGAGRGALLVTGHYGNWEIGGLMMRRVLNLPLTVVAMAESNPEVNRLRRETRARMGVDTLEVRQSLETALQIRRTLAENRLVAMLIDRHLGRDRVPVTLFGRPALFLHTPALLGYLSGAPLVPCFLERVAPGRFTTHAVAPIFVDRQLTRDAAIQQATQRVADAIESRVRVNPHAWYHFYRYWDAQRDEYPGTRLSSARRMDPVSHVALGYGLAAAASRAVTGRSVSVAAVLGALSPDIDLLIAPGGWDRYLTVHEAGTHSLAGAAMCGVLTSCLVRAVWRDSRYAVVAASAVIGSLSHIAFDLASGATIRLAWPLSDARVGNLGTFAMGDPMVLAPCALGLLLLWRRPARRSRDAMVLLVLLFALFAFKTSVRTRAEAVYQSQKGVQPEVDVKHYLIVPVFGSITRWRVYDRGADLVGAWDVDVADGTVQLDFEAPQYDHLHDDVITRSREWVTVRNFQRAHDFVFATAQPRPGGGTRVLWSDVRYCHRVGDGTQAAGSMALVSSASRPPIMCAVGAGGEVNASGGLVRLLVIVGDWAQSR